MNILGLSYGYHDSSACLIIDGIVHQSIAEERLTQQKHDANFPTFAIDEVLKNASLSMDDIDQVVFHEDPFQKFSRVLTSSIAPFPSSRREFVNTAKTWLGKKLWALNSISKRLDVHPSKISYFNHHFSHAVTAFMGSGFKESAILVIDAVGDWSSTAIYKGEWINGKPEIKSLLEISFPHSLGLTYSSFTAFLGFRPNDSECSTMAIAAFGKPKYVEKVKKIIKVLDDKTYKIDQKYFNFSNFYKGPLTKHFIELFGEARNAQTPLTFDCFKKDKTIKKEDQFYADVAASVQFVLEETVLNLTKKAKELFISENLCYAGGVALNCVCNDKILNNSPYTNLFIPIDPGDGGTSIGTSLYYNYQNQLIDREKLRYNPYIGSNHSEEEVLTMIPDINPDQHQRYLYENVKSKKGTSWKCHTFENTKDLCKRVASLLYDNKIIGWYNGKSEVGPRALGNRSILIRPDNLELAHKLSTKVKHRAAYRPYAISVTKEDALNILDINLNKIDNYRWMQYSAKVKRKSRNAVRAAIHIDNSTRPHICKKEDNRVYHNLLSEFGKLFGQEVLLNTSFNASGYPIVSTPLEALSILGRSDMDAIVLNNSLIWKEIR